MNKQEVMKLQTCVLKVNVHCEGCKHKVKKQLQKIEGVYSVKADVEQGKVTVTGNVDPAVLIKKLSKSGKHAELCGGGGGGGGGKGLPNLNAQLNNPNLNGKVVNMGNPKGGKDQHQGKGNGGGGGGHPMQHLGPQQIQQLMMMKGIHGGGKDVKMPKEQKSVKFADDFDDEDDDDDEFDDDDDEFDDDDDEFDDDDEIDDEDEDEDDEVDHGHGHGLPKQMMMPNKMAPMGHGPKGPNDMMMMMNALNKGGGGAGNKGGGAGFEIPVQMKGMGGGKNEGKNGNEGKKIKEKGKKEGKGTEEAGGKNGKTESKSSGLLGFLRKGKSGKGDEKKGGAMKKDGGGGGNKVKSGDDDDFDDVPVPKKGGLKGGHNGGAHDIEELMKQMKGGNKPNQQPKGNQQHKGFAGPMGQAGPMGNYPAVQGLPMSGGGGYYPAAAPVNHQMSQQQYMHMMMSQQQAAAQGGGYGGHHGGDMYHPMMYARPYPSVNYAHPPPMPPPHRDSYTHLFSDENPDSCSIM